jgi:hypothetical protein
MLAENTTDKLFGNHINKTAQELIQSSVSRWPQICLSSFSLVESRVWPHLEKYILDVLRTVNQAYRDEIRYLSFSNDNLNLVSIVRKRREYLNIHLKGREKRSPEFVDKRLRNNSQCTINYLTT